MTLCPVVSFNSFIHIAFFFFFKDYLGRYWNDSLKSTFQVWWWSILSAFIFVKISIVHPCLWRTFSLYIEYVMSGFSIFTFKKMWFIFLLLFFLTWSAFIYSYHSPVCILLCLLSRCFGSLLYNFRCLSLSVTLCFYCWVHQAS